MRFFRRKYIVIALGIIVLVILALAGGLFVYVQSSAFETVAQGYITREIARRSGAVVELKGFHWSLLQRRVQLEGLTLRGREPASEAPLAMFPRIDIGINIRSLFQRKINLFELTLTNPALHIVIDPQGQTNFPTPPPQQEPSSLNVEVAIENFRFVHGTALLREGQIDTDFVVTNLASEMSFHSTTGILNSHVRFDGEYARFDAPAIPYTFDADMDYTRGTLLPHRITLESGASVIKLQGRINDLLSKKIAGRLEYTGNAQIPFLNYFFPTEKLAGKADVAGFLEFANGYFFTSGNTAADSVNYDGWLANELHAEYSYHFPDRRAAFKNLRTRIAGGRLAGSVTIEDVPGPSRVVIALDYAGIDGEALSRIYPWPQIYRIQSNLTGSVRGWFQGKFERYSLSGNVALKSFNRQAKAGEVPLSLDGSTNYEVNPGQARVANTDLILGSTHIRADGLIDTRASDLKVVLESSNLRDAYFIYTDANGSGTFNGTLAGPIQNPVFNGDFTLQQFVYQSKWTIENATGHVTLPTATQIAVLENVHLIQGRSEIIVNGSSALKGSPADLSIRALQVYGDDLRPFVDRKIGGTIAGTVRLTSFSPINVEGDLHADNLRIDDQVVGNLRTHLRYFDPAIDLSSLSMERNGSTLTGNFSFDRSTEGLRFSTQVSSVDFDALRMLGLPDGLNGVVAQASLQGEGTVKQPNIRGTGIIRNLSYKTQTFSEVRVDLSSVGANVNATLQTGSNLTVAVQINTGSNTYPYTARATFTQYPLERQAGLSQGKLTATGVATMSGLLKDAKALHGEGRIESAEAEIQDKVFRTTSPFTFDFNTDRLALSKMTVAGAGTEGTVAGTIGLTNGAALSLDVRGKFDLALLAAANADWTTTGAIDVDGRIRGTPENPELSGIAHLTDASVTRPGFFTSLNGVNGDVAFDGNRITLNGVKGQMGGGTITVEGAAVLKQAQLQSMNFRIDTSSVRIRYPEGLRTVVDGSLNLRGSWDSPLLEGDLKILSMTYRSSFEDFVDLFGTVGTASGETPPNRLRLAIHVEGGRNITIQNELANVEARVSIDVRGSAGKPSLTGHVEASGGTLSFQGKHYTVTRGNVDFVDPLKIEPVVDVQAETQIRDYRVILAVTGRGEHLRVDMRSDPPLPQIEVINLIAGGKSRDELAERGTNVTQEQLFKGSAASILSDIVQQRIGGNSIQRLGIGRVRIGPDPSIVSSRNQTTIRVTIEEQVSKDLTVTYSRELSADKQEIIQIEYFVNKNISVIASRDEFDEKGLDIKFRKRFK